MRARLPHVLCFLTAGLLVLLLSAVAGAASGDAEDPDQSFDLSQTSIERTSPDDRWRERGLAFVDLPLGFRARFETGYSRPLYSSEALARPFVTDVGPRLRSNRTLESRVSLSRSLGPGVELEIAWETRNNLATHDPMGFGRQTIGAMIRIAP